jgi:hypothetical protein
MDIIDDVDSAMAAYLKNEFPTDTGEKYLRIYGAMQGLFLQQDALLDLIKAIHPTKEICLNDVLKDIREARNASVGHPTQLRRKGVLSAHGIIQNSMNKDGFDLLSYPEKDGKIFQYVPVRELIGKQEVETVRILSEVVNDLREQEQAHRSKFRAIKLMKAFDGAGYAFEKIFEEVRGDEPVLSCWAVDHLQKSLDDFAKLLMERGIGINSYDSIEYLYKEIEHPLTELRKYLLREPSEILSDKSAIVFANALRVHFDDLRHIAQEIDQEYTSEPDPIVKPVPQDIPITVTTTISGN